MSQIKKLTVEKLIFLKEHEHQIFYRHNKNAVSLSELPPEVWAEKIYNELLKENVFSMPVFVRDEERTDEQKFHDDVYSIKGKK